MKGESTLPRNNGRPPGNMGWTIAEYVALALLISYFAVIFHGLLFMTGGVNERDGFYHARYSQMLPMRGLSRSLPWMQFTSWKDEFCDKDFLYHVYMAPFCTDANEPLAGAKIGTLVLAMGSLLALFAVLKRFRTPWPLFWVALMASGSGLLLVRMIMVRSHDLSILLMIVAFWAILERRRWACFSAAFVYAWSYSFPVAMLITAFGAEAGRNLLLRTNPIAERTPWRELGAHRIPLFVLAGLAAGLVFHPYFPYSITSIWMILEITLFATVGGQIELGSEFRPIGFSDAFTISPGTTGALLVAITLAILLRADLLKGRKLSTMSAGAVAAAAGWTCGMFVFSRMIEYAGSISVIAAALTVRDALTKPEVSATEKIADTKERARMLALAALLVAAIAACHDWSTRLVRGYTVSQRQFYQSDEAFIRGRYFDGAAKWMHENLTAKSVVLNFHWDDFPEIFYSAPEQYYVVGLDPTLMQYKYPDEAFQLEQMRTGKAPLDFERLKYLFGTEYMIMRKYRAAKYEFLKSGAVRPVYSDAEAVIYKL